MNQPNRCECELSLQDFVAVCPVAFQHTDTVTCTPPWYVMSSTYHPTTATYQPLVNGEETFAAVHMAIARAVRSVDIVCWGFQPSMFLIRNMCTPSIGELLMIKAQEGVEVRVLGWEFPLNLAGFAGETNLPGKGRLRIMQRELQHTTEDQYEFDRYWFRECCVSAEEARKPDPRKPLFVSRGFSKDERAEIAHWARYESLDPMISSGMQRTLKLAPSHHQKTILVDYEIPDRAVGFVMGHNLLDEYWDTDAHSALNRSPQTKPAPNIGARGKQPRQDISCQISGPILEHLHHNFAEAWRKETGDDLLVKRQAMQIGPQLQCTRGAIQQIAQIVRTRPPEARQDRKKNCGREIEHLYFQAANNATRFIYIENQYFRWPPFAELIKSVANNLTKGGSDPGEHGALHLFVITNATDEGMGAGTVNTQRMLESLGRADTIPGVTKERRIEQVKKNAPLKPTPDLRDRVGQMELKRWQDKLDAEIKVINDAKIESASVPGLKIHVCSLVAPDSPAGRDWMPVYIHSKLMIVNDAFTTHGSANINSRSMAVDSELNIAHDWVSVTKALRRRLWKLHTGGLGDQDDPTDAFNAWAEIIKQNKKRQEEKTTPYAPLVEFHYAARTLKDLD